MEKEIQRVKIMLRKTAYALMIAIVTISLFPSIGMCWRPGNHGGPGPYYGGHHYGGHYYGGYHGDDAWVWGLSGLVIGAALIAASRPYPPPQSVEYVSPPPRRAIYALPSPPVYAYKPDIPPGMCRWERSVLDNYGRVILDQYGNPILQYTIWSCQSPPY